MLELSCLLGRNISFSIVGTEAVIINELDYITITGQEYIDTVSGEIYSWAREDWWDLNRALEDYKIIETIQSKNFYVKDDFSVLKDRFESRIKTYFYETALDILKDNMLSMFFPDEFQD